MFFLNTIIILLLFINNLAFYQITKKILYINNKKICVVNLKNIHF